MKVNEGWGPNLLGLVSLQEEGPQSSLSSHRHKRSLELSDRWPPVNQGRTPQVKTYLASTLVLDSLVSRTVRNKLCGLSHLVCGILQPELSHQHSLQLEVENRNTLLKRS